MKSSVVPQWPSQLSNRWQWRWHNITLKYHGGGFFLTCKDFGRMFDCSFPVCFFLSFFLSGHKLTLTDSTLYVRISSQWLSELRLLQLNVPWQVACEFISEYGPTLCLDSSIVSLPQLHWVKDVCMFMCNLPPEHSGEWLGSFTCHCLIMGGTDPEWESAHKVNSGEDNSAAAPAGIQTCKLSITSPTLLPTSYPGL